MSNVSAATDVPTGTPKGHSRLGWALVLISVAQLMVVLDGTIVNIALPFIQKDLDIASANLAKLGTGGSAVGGAAAPAPATTGIVQRTK